MENLSVQILTSDIHYIIVLFFLTTSHNILYITNYIVRIIQKTIYFTEILKDARVQKV